MEYIYVLTYIILEENLEIQIPIILGSGTSLDMEWLLESIAYAISVREDADWRLDLEAAGMQRKLGKAMPARIAWTRPHGATPIGKSNVQWAHF